MSRRTTPMPTLASVVRVCESTGALNRKDHFYIKKDHHWFKAYPKQGFLIVVETSGVIVTRMIARAIIESGIAPKVRCPNSTTIHIYQFCKWEPVLPGLF